MTLLLIFLSQLTVFAGDRPGFEDLRELTISPEIRRLIVKEQTRYMSKEIRINRPLSQLLRPESITPGECHGPGTGPANPDNSPLLACVKEHNVQFIHNQKARIATDLGNLERERAALAGTTESRGLNYKEWMTAEIARRRDAKIQELQLYTIAEDRLRCDDPKRDYSSMPMFENVDQMQKYLSDEIMPDPDDRVMRKVFVGEQFRFDRKFGHKVQSADRADLALKGESMLSGEERLRAVYNFIMSNDVEFFEKRFPLHGDIRPTDRVEHTDIPREKLLLNRPQLVDFMRDNPGAIKRLMDENREFRAKLQRQMTLGESLLRNLPHDATPHPLRNVDLASAMQFELRTDIFDQKFSKPEYLAYERNLKKGLDRNEQNLEGAWQAMTRLTQEGCLKTLDTWKDEDDAFLESIIAGDIYWETDFYSRNSDVRNGEQSEYQTKLGLTLTEAERAQLKVPEESIESIRQRKIQKDGLRDQMYWIQQRHDAVHAKYVENNLQELIPTDETTLGIIGDNRTALASAFPAENHLFVKPGDVDLSYLFSAPSENQGDSLACLPNALASDLEMARVQNGKVIPPTDLSPARIYGLVRASDFTQVDQDHRTNINRRTFAEMTKLPAHRAFAMTPAQLAATPSDQVSAVLSQRLDKGITPDMINGQVSDTSALLFSNLPAQGARPGDQPHLHVPESIGRSATSTYVKNYTQDDYRRRQPPPVEFIQRSLDQGQPVMVIIDKSTRRTYEDWIKMEEGGDYSHAVHIVGYGTGADPFDGREKRFFRVRDSMCATPVCTTYNISAEEAMLSLEHVMKVTEIERTGH